MTDQSSQTPFGEAAQAKYVQLTTFRKDGTPVATPLWAAIDGGQLTMWTAADSWKVKRIRRDPRVVVQACDARGRKTTGVAVNGTAEILDDAGTEKVRGLIIGKYGILGWLTVKGSLLRRGKSGTVGLSITPAP
ncbi:PPOX class F420-dependent oxidoreductase [Gordonia sp. SL306]|uniref:PPOX class F420-dependent oxidoreductase n=1 Tax=Gordonia sp. SL306 TaxID=2995145 RepID=UPI00226EB147|nr:PPOX class F420-dependent oxidoreductase [Gordonia sp. SL306]WAC57005.1 PPOX class F420-dependent oxidoreductase [Gordonia sp. SL306]